MSDKTAVDLSGAQVCINGEECYVKSGQLVARFEYLKDAHGEPQGILEQDISIDVELWEPPEDDGGDLGRSFLEVFGDDTIQADTGGAEAKIQHTDALELCNDLKQLQGSISTLFHELVLHYSATGVPAHKTAGKISSVRRKIDSVLEQLDTIDAELEGLDR